MLLSVVRSAATYVVHYLFVRVPARCGTYISQCGLRPTFHHESRSTPGTTMDEPETLIIPGFKCVLHTTGHADCVRRIIVYVNVLIELGGNVHNSGFVR